MLNRGQTSNTENNQLYYIENDNINKLTKKASTYFNAFRNRGDQQSLTSSTQYFEDAIKLAETEDNKLDLAHCLRRYASTVIRDQSDPDSASKASTCLSRAINIYNDQEIQTDIIKLEKARAIDLQRHVAHELKSGQLLEECANQMLQLYHAKEINNYVVNAYEALFHCAFAKGELK